VVDEAVVGFWSGATGLLPLGAKIRTRMSITRKNTKKPAKMYRIYLATFTITLDPGA